MKSCPSWKCPHCFIYTLFSDVELECHEQSKQLWDISLFEYGNAGNQILNLFVMEGQVCLRERKEGFLVKYLLNFVFSDT